MIYSGDNRKKTEESIVRTAVSRSRITLLAVLAVLFQHVQQNTHAALAKVQDPNVPAIKYSEFLFDTAPFKSCHASTIAESNGKLVIACFRGSAEAAPDVGIWLTRQIKNHWTDPVEVANGVQSPSVQYPCWNPVLYQAKHGPLLLFYKVGQATTNWWGMLARSFDGGCSWSPAERLPNGILGPIKNKPVLLASGELLCPSSEEEGRWSIHFERTADLGKTWKSTGPLPANSISAIQPTILGKQLHLQALGRTRQSRIFSVESEDGGKSWGDITLTELPNPNSGIDAVTLKDNTFLLVYNDSFTRRTRLTVATSPNGKTWTPKVTLEDGRGDFSYPAVIQTHDGLVHVVYTWNRRKIKHVVLNPAALREPQPIRQ